VMPKPINSEITGEQNPDPRRSSETGTQLLASGSEGPTNIGELTGVDGKIKAWLPRSIRLWLARNRGIDVAIGRSDDDGFDEKEGRIALAMLEAIDRPIERVDCLRALARLKVLTRERNLTSDDLKAQILAYCDELSAYPADVVFSATREWAATSKWFPSWSELRLLCDDYARKRRSMARMLRERLNAPGEEDGTPGPYGPIQPTVRRM
jgi:hypothetical protein